VHTCYLGVFVVVTCFKLMKDYIWFEFFDQSGLVVAVQDIHME